MLYFSKGPSSAYSTKRTFWKQQHCNQELRDGLTLKNIVMGWRANLRVERLFRRTVAIGQYQSRPGLKPVQKQREVESNQDGLMSYCTCHTLPPAVLLSSWILWPPSLRCTESEDSSDLNSENLYQQQPVFLIFHVFRLVIRCTAQCHLQTLPTVQATPALTDSFSRGHDHFAHAWKVRPLTFVGWTSLSVSLSLSLKGLIGETPVFCFIAGWCLTLSPTTQCIPSLQSRIGPGMGLASTACFRRRLINHDNVCVSCLNDFGWKPTSKGSRSASIGFASVHVCPSDVLSLDVCQTWRCLFESFGDTQNSNCNAGRCGCHQKSGPWWCMYRVCPLWSDYLEHRSWNCSAWIP